MLNFLVMLFFVCANTSYGACTSAANAIHVIALDSSSGPFEHAPFKARVNIWPTTPSKIVEVAAVGGGAIGASIAECQEDFAEEAKAAANHGVMVSSLLVAAKPIGHLPPGVKIHLTDSTNGWEDFVAKAHAQGLRETDLLLVNWSGIASATDVGHLEEEISGIALYYSEELKTKSLADLIEETEGNIDEIRNSLGDSNDIFKCFNAIFDILKSDSPSDVKIRAAVAELTEDMRAISEATSQKHIQQLLDALTAFPNTLIVWALGNEGKCIDKDTCLGRYLSMPEILSRVVLVEGNNDNTRHPDSNFTEMFAAHVINRPFMQSVWSPEQMRAVQESGTSFAAPVATADAYKIAKAMMDKGSSLSYLKIKEQLLKGK